MMNFIQKIEKDFLTAYKAKEGCRVAVLRMLKTAIKNKQVELGTPPDDDQVLSLVAKQAKQRKESIDQFRAAGRDDLADKEQAELEILSEYLPKALTDDELAQLVDAAVKRLGASSLKDMGAVMQAVMSEGGGGVDGKKASTLVRQRLSSQTA